MLQESHARPLLRDPEDQAALADQEQRAQRPGHQLPEVQRRPRR